MKQEAKKCDGNDKGKKRGHNQRGRGNHNMRHVVNGVLFTVISVLTISFLFIMMTSDKEQCCIEVCS